MKRIILGVVGLIIAGAIIIGNTPFLNAQTETGTDGKVEGEVVGGSEATVDVPTLSFDEPVEEPQEEPEEPVEEPGEEPQEEPEEEPQEVIIPEKPTVPETAEQTPTPVTFIEESKVVVSTYNYEEPVEEVVVEDTAVEENVAEEIIVPASEEEELVPACTEEELLVVADEEEEIQTPDAFNTKDYILFGAATLIVIGGLFSIIKFVRG